VHSLDDFGHKHGFCKEARKFSINCNIATLSSLVRSKDTL
jgi:hypothetical protein